MSAATSGPLGLDPALLGILACPDTHHSPLTVDEAASELVCTTCRRLVHRQRAVVGVRAGQDLQQRRVDAQRALAGGGHARTSPSTSSRSAAIAAASGASTLSRSSGSVLLARRLNHEPSGRSTVSPSSSSTVTPSSSSKA